MQSSESTISSNQSFSCFLCPQRPTPRPTGAQEVRTSRWPAGTWSWRSPPSSACTSRGRHGHNDCGEHLWILSDIADGWNRIWFVWKAFWGRKIIHSTLCGIFFLLCFQVIFFSLSCKYYDFFFIIIVVIILSFLLFWLLDHLMNQCAAPAPPLFHSYQKAPKFPHQSVSFERFSSGGGGEKCGKNDIFICFCTLLKKKKERKTQLCQLS